MEDAQCDETRLKAQPKELALVYKLILHTLTGQSSHGNERQNCKESEARLQEYVFNENATIVLLEMRTTT